MKNLSELAEAWRNQRWRVLASAFILSSVFPFYYQFKSSFWELLGQVTGRSSCALVKAIGFSAVCTFDSDRTNLALADFGICINPDSSGLMGVMLFATIWSLVLLWRKSVIKPPHWLFVCALGGIYMMGLNVVRIGLLFALSLKAKGMAASATQAYLELAIQYLGWSVYLSGLGLFFFLLSKFSRDFGADTVPA